jgi:hypothetical protein
MNFGNRAKADALMEMTRQNMGQSAPMPMVTPDPYGVPPVPMPMMEPDPNAVPPVPMPQIDPSTINQGMADQMMNMTEEDMRQIVEMFKQYMNKSPQVGVPEQQGQQSLEDIIGQAVMGYMGGQ